MKDKIAAYERNLDDLALDEDVRIELRGFAQRNYGRMELWRARRMKVRILIFQSAA